MAFSIPTNTIAANMEWSETFRDVVVADPTAYGLTAPEAADVDTVVVAYRAAFDVAGVESRVAVNAAGYTKPGRAALYSARDDAMALIIPLAGAIQTNPGITNGEKLTAGIQPRTTTHAPIPAPATIPVLGVLSLTPQVVNLSVADSSTPALKAKPYGVNAAAIYANIGVAPDMDPTNASQIGTATRTPHSQNFGAADVGKVATIFARWRTNKGVSGDWSAPVVVNIA